MECKERIVIGIPEIEYQNGTAYLKALISENGTGREFFFSVAEEYGEGLTSEVCDCFLVAILSHAMIARLDIECKAPVSRSLLYSVRHRLIPELAVHTKRYHQIEVMAEPSDVRFEKNSGAGLGWSGGADCLYTYTKMVHAQEPHYRLTHLLTINAGAFEGSEQEILEKFRISCAMTGDFASQAGLRSLAVDTNLQLMLEEHYLSVGPQRLCAGALALQKLLSVYYISSAYEVTAFSYDEQNSAYYDYALCSCFSTQNLTFFDIGSEITRIEKLRILSDEPVAQKNLHVCVKQEKGNCMRCGKCVRTVAALYALGKLDKFGQVFDLEFAFRNMDRILGDTYYHRKSHHYREVLDLLEEKGIELSPQARRYAAFLEIAEKSARKNEKILLEKVKPAEQGTEPLQESNGT